MSFLRSAGANEIDLKKLGVDDELLDLLFDIGILGVCRSYFVHADAVFKGYIAARPKSERARLGLGLLALARPNFDEAIKVFKDDLLKLNPKNDFARCYLGLAYKEKHMHDEARECFNHVIKSNSDESAVTLAKAALEKLEEKEQGNDNE